jgi:opacity protein-like surface antigen
MAALGASGFDADALRAAEQPEPAVLSTPVAQPTVLVAQAAVPAPAPYQQGKGFYATIGLGAQRPQALDFNSDIYGLSRRPSGRIGGGGGGFSGDLGIGYDFGAIRTELTYGSTQVTYGGGGNAWDTPPSLLRSTVDNDGTNSYLKHDLLVSAYWDFATGSRWTPYLGGGIGWTHLNTPDIPGSSGGGRNLFGYQAKLGLSHGVSESVDVYVEGVYQGTPGFRGSSPFGSTDYGSFNSWGAKLGARFRFGGAR